MSRYKIMLLGTPGILNSSSMGLAESIAALSHLTPEVGVSRNQCTPVRELTGIIPSLFFFTRQLKDTFGTCPHVLVPSPQIAAHEKICVKMPMTRFFIWHKFRRVERLLTSDKSQSVCQNRDDFDHLTQKHEAPASPFSPGCM